MFGSSIRGLTHVWELATQPAALAIVATFTIAWFFVFPETFGWGARNSVRAPAHAFAPRGRANGSDRSYYGVGALAVLRRRWNVKLARFRVEVCQVDDAIVR